MVSRFDSLCSPSLISSAFRGIFETIFHLSHFVFVGMCMWWRRMEGVQSHYVVEEEEDTIFFESCKIKRLFSMFGIKKKTYTSFCFKYHSKWNTFIFSSKFFEFFYKFELYTKNLTNFLRLWS